MNQRIFISSYNSYFLLFRSFTYEKVKSVSDLYAKSLPPKNEWYSSLTEKIISDEDLKFAEDFWKTFE